MHVAWVRSMVLDRERLGPRIGEIERLIRKHRSMLLDLAPVVLPLSS
jgi:hypothetical protein